MDHSREGERLAERRAQEILAYQDELVRLRPIAGGSAAAAAPLVTVLVPLLIQELPAIIASATRIVNLVRSHPDTPEAEKAAMDAAFTHLEAAAAAVAAVQV